MITDEQKRCALGILERLIECVNLDEYCFSVRGENSVVIKAHDQEWMVYFTIDKGFPSSSDHWCGMENEQ